MTDKHQAEIDMLLRAAAAHAKAVGFGPILAGGERLDISENSRQFLRDIVDRFLIVTDERAAGVDKGEPENANEDTVTDAPYENAEDLPERPDGDLTYLDEALRVYQYPGGDEVRVPCPRELIVRPSGTHRIKDDTGLLYVVNPGWLSIRIDNKGRGWDV